MATSELKRVGKTQYIGMLVAKAAPQNRAKKTLLLRFNSQEGTSTLFTATGDAFDAFAGCELWRFYELEVPGKCIKKSGGLGAYGLLNPLEVHMQFPCHISLDDSLACCCFL